MSPGLNALRTILQQRLAPRVRLIAFAGYAGSGKDAAADLVGWPKRAWAEPVYRATLALNPWVFSEGRYLRDLVRAIGWDRAKREHPEVRGWIQRVGTEAGRGIHGPDCWVRLADLTPPCCFVGTRFANEAQAVWAAGGRVVWVARPGVGPANEHASEHGLSPGGCDYVLRNDGTLEDLAESVRVMLGHFGLGGDA